MSHTTPGVLPEPAAEAAREALQSSVRDSVRAAGGSYPPRIEHALERVTTQLDASGLADLRDVLDFSVEMSAMIGR